MKLKCAVVGMGGIGNTHAKCYSENPLSELVAVCDLVKEKVPLSETVIKQIHTLVLSDKPMDRGVYRRVPVRIMGAKNEPVQPYMIEPKMC